jgi:hypothetical protein
MNDWISIVYRGFWDVPRVFLTRYRSNLLLFECLFDQTLDDYPDNYQVYVLPDIHEEALPKDWTSLSSQAVQRLGEIPVASVRFDPTMRKQIQASVLDELYAQKVAS